MRYFALIMLGFNPILWASFYAVTKSALAQLDPIAFSTMELGVAVLPALGLAFMVKGALRLPVILRGILLGSVLYAAVLTSTIALYFTTATNTAFFPALSGIMGAVIGAVFWHQKLQPLTWGAGLLSLLGCVFLIHITAGNSNLWLGDLIALLAAFIYTLYVFCVGANEKYPVKILAAMFVVEIVTMALLGGLVFLVWSRFHHQPVHVLANLKVILYVGLFTSFLPTAIALYFQRFAGAVTVTFLYALEPGWGAFMAHMIDHETLPLSAYLAGGIIIIGSILETVRGVRGTQS